MKWRLEAKNRPTLFVAAAAGVAGMLAVWLLFLPVIREAGETAEKNARSLAAAERLLRSQTEIEARYARAAGNGAGDDWVRRLADVSKRHGVIFDAILPEPVDGGVPGETGVRVGFRSDVARFSAFVHSLASDDPLCLIRDMKLEKGENGLLKCELALSRVPA